MIAHCGRRRSWTSRERKSRSITTIPSRISLACWCAIAASTVAPALSAQDTSLVVVEKDRVEITMIPPKLRIRQPRVSQIGFYSWRLDLKTADGLSIVLASDTLMRTDNVRDIGRGSTLRRCADGKDFSSLRCRTVMTDSVSMRGDKLRIVIRDSAIVAMVRKDRPSTMWGSTFEPNGRFRVDRLTVDFDDDDKDEKPPLPDPGIVRPKNGRRVPPVSNVRQPKCDLTVAYGASESSAPSALYICRRNAPHKAP